MRGVLALLLACCATLALGAELDPSSPQLGQRAWLTLSDAPADSSELPLGLNVVLLAQEDDPTRFEVVVVRVGEVGIALPATGDTLRWEVSGEVEEADPGALRPLRAVGDVGPNWWPTVLVVLLVVAPLVIWLVLRALRRPARAAAFEMDAEPAHVLALRRLDQIDGEGWPARGEFERFYVEASHAVREYIGRRFRVDALDATSEETLRRLTDVGYAAERMRPVDPLLRSADEVKFAAHRPTEHSAEEWMRTAREWIGQTGVAAVWTTPETVAAIGELHEEVR